MLLLVAAFSSPSFSQEPSLGDVARATRARQAKSPQPAKAFSNEDSGPVEIKDGEDPLQVFEQARIGLLHSTSYRCQQESSGNSGPGWRKSESYEVAAADRMRMVAREGSDQVEWLLIGDDYYEKPNRGPWKKLTSPQELALAKMVFPGLTVPLGMQFQPGELKSLGDQVVAGVRTVLYRFTTHNVEMDRTINFWFGKQDSLPRRVEMRTESKSSGTAPIIWQESTSCSYGVVVKIEPPQ